MITGGLLECSTHLGYIDGLVRHPQVDMVFASSIWVFLF